MSRKPESRPWWYDRAVHLRKVVGRVPGGIYFVRLGALQQRLEEAEGWLSLDLDQWERLCRTLLPELYAEPPAEDDVACQWPAGTAERTDCMAARQSRGEGLRRGADRDLVREDAVARLARPSAGNTPDCWTSGGVRQPCELVAKDDPPPPPATDPGMW